VGRAEAQVARRFSGAVSTIAHLLPNATLFDILDYRKNASLFDFFLQNLA